MWNLKLVSDSLIPFINFDFGGNHREFRQKITIFILLFNLSRLANVRDNSRSSIVNITMKKCSIPNIFTPYNKFLYDFVATGNNFENQIFHCLDKDIS